MTYESVVLYVQPTIYKLSILGKTNVVIICIELSTQTKPSQGYLYSDYICPIHETTLCQCAATTHVIHISLKLVASIPNTLTLIVLSDNALKCHAVFLNYY